ncbi:3-hydroxyisobutyrate dehydrogenase [Ketobacter sp.]|uniref:3-hydroxyisobutyrate dehydrogenase n=1 Tax=Ketobacter sp. TaxID=2083498 RepID=UPI000F0F5748|nr:3-hydroxyisobutyrate dehydrogenase [Ketobacter sp.]RLT94460.1 MAG: 3-hydroxyisobutyrate dehydrogenase [Ketobacter sp.]
MATIGFIGVGNMGGPMAINLVKAGHQVKVFDLSAELKAKVVSQGAEGVDSPQAAVANAEFVISMLPSGPIVESLYIHQDKLLDAISDTALVIDCSTIAPENAINLFKAADAKGITTLDAPVSGGVGGATAGTLTFIVGGDDDAFARAKPILSAMGKNVFHAGGHGAGQTAKICNNMLLAIHMVGTAEALQLGVDNGLDPKVLSDIMLQSSGRNWSLELYNPYPGVMETAPASQDYAGGFQVNLMNKDLGLAMEAALKSQSTTPMGTLAKSLYSQHGRNGWGMKDFSSIQRWFDKAE